MDTQGESGRDSGRASNAHGSEVHFNSIERIQDRTEEFDPGSD